MPFGEPLVDGREHRARLVAPPAGQRAASRGRWRRAARRTSPAARWRASIARRRLSSAAASLPATAQQLAAHPVQLGEVAALERLLGVREAFVHRPKAFVDRGRRPRASRRAARGTPCARGRIRSPAARRGCPSAGRCPSVVRPSAASATPWNERPHSVSCGSSYSRESATISSPMLTASAASPR